MKTGLIIGFLLCLLMVFCCFVVYQKTIKECHYDLVLVNLAEKRIKKTSDGYENISMDRNLFKKYIDSVDESDSLLDIF